MSDIEQQEEKKDTKSPIVIGIFAFTIFALATAMNYGGLFQHSALAAQETVAPATSETPAK
jgi:hypothetical protein